MVTQAQAQVRAHTDQGEQEVNMQKILDKQFSTHLIYVLLCDRQREKIQATKAPQVLKIDHDHDDAISLSGDDESIISSSDEEAHVEDDDPNFDLSLPKELQKYKDDDGNESTPPPDSGISVSEQQEYGVIGEISLQRVQI